MANKRGLTVVKPDTSQLEAQLAITDNFLQEYEELDTSTKEELAGYEEEIKGLIRQTLENVIRLGEIFTHIKTNLLPFRTWKFWLEAKFNDEISTDTALNWMNVYTLNEEYKERYPESLERVGLKALYKLSTTGVAPEEKETVLEIAAEAQAPLNLKDTKRVIDTYRKIRLTSAGLEPETVKLLTKTEIADEPKQVEALRKLSKVKRHEVTQKISTGEAHSVKEALRLIKEEIEEATINVETVHVNYTEIIVDRYGSLDDLESESINVALVEAPMRFDYIESELTDLGNKLERVLVPGGFAIITVGHKSAMFVGSVIEGIKPIHLLCLRRQPGNSRTIVGLNIASASVFAILAYKSPYKPPVGLLVDLQTLTETEALVGLDEVQNGLEKSFEYFLESMLSGGDTLLHHVVSSDHFNIEGSLIEIAKELNAKRFVSVR